MPRSGRWCDRSLPADFALNALGLRLRTRIGPEDRMGYGLAAGIECEEGVRMAGDRNGRNALGIQ